MEMRSSKNDVLLFGSFCLDLAERRLMRDGKPVPLEPKVFDTLVLLVQNRGHLLEKDELMKRVWPDAFVEESSLTRNVSTLRKALGEGENGFQYIETVPKHGYRFVAKVTDSGNQACDLVTIDGALRPTEQSVGAVTGTREVIRHHKRVPVLAGLILLIALVVVGYSYFSGSSKGPINSVAVLPFVNLSDDPNMDHISDGITETLINNLSQLPQLKVIARSSAFQYKGKQIEPDKVARTLGVRAIVTGRIKRQGDNLQISVELMDAGDKTQMWGEQYDRRMSDLQAIQAQVAWTVAQKLRLRLTSVQEQQLTKRPTENAQAYQLYLTGVFHLRKQNLDGHKKALEYYDQAVTLDPNFALAFGSMPAVYANLAGTGGLDPKEAIAKGKAAAMKALQLDENLSVAHSGMAIVLRYEWDWPGAELEFKRAIELNPNADGAHSSYSLLLSVMGRTTEALAENKIAQELDPFRITFRGNEGGILISGRRYDEALQVSQNVIRMQPEYPFGHLNLAHAYLGKGMFEEAIKEYKTAMSLYGDTPNAMIDLGYAYAVSGKRHEALAILNRLKNSKVSVSPAGQALLYTGLGNKEAAFEMLEQAFSTHDPLVGSLKVEPRFDSLRADPRFADLLRRMKLTS